jgi:hypothetical protein
VFFENSVCLRCGTELGFDPGVLDLVRVDPAAHARCNNRRAVGCNWLVPASRDGDRCLSCALTRTRPSEDDGDGLRAWADVESAKHRLVHQLLDLGLPMDGLAFDLLSSRFGPVTTGHADGIITLDLAEADDARREQRRSELGEPYRTVLGHLRHEVGHYYWMVLVEQGGHVEAFRERFGDERDDYQACLDRHYTAGPADGWQRHFVSAYATAHPWEDFAETWAHWLHMVDGLETAREHGLAAVATGPADPDHAGDADVVDAMVRAWAPLADILNELGRGLGHPPAFPFEYGPVVIEKLAFVHRAVRQLVGRAHAG